VHKAQGAHADHTALLDDIISRPSTMLQQLGHQVSLLGNTLETIVPASSKIRQGDLGANLLFVHHYIKKL